MTWWQKLLSFLAAAFALVGLGWWVGRDSGNGKVVVHENPIPKVEGEIAKMEARVAIEMVKIDERAKADREALDERVESEAARLASVGASDELDRRLLALTE